MHDVDKSNLDRGTPSTNSSDVINPDNVMSHKTISTHYATDADTSTGRLQMQNKQIVVNDGTTNRMIEGILSDGTIGQAFYDTSSNLISKNTGATQTRYDASGNIISTEGLMPNGGYGKLTYSGVVPITLEGTRVANGSNGIGSNQQGTFVAKAGIDVTLATNAQLIFNSNQDVFKIVGTLTISVSSFVYAGVASTWTYGLNTVTTAHGLSYVPAFDGYVLIGSQYLKMPYTSMGVGGGSPSWILLRPYADATNIYIDVAVTAYSANVTTPASTVKIYLLQETAS